LDPRELDLRRDFMQLKARMKDKQASLAVSPEVLATLVGFADEYLE
jgi:hypothetical protein